MNWRNPLTFSLFTILVHACGVFAQQVAQPGSTPNKAPASLGRQIFSSSCASCHGLDGRGGERAPDIVTKPELTRLSEAETIKLIRAGVPEKGMPPFDSLGTAKLTALVSYLRSLQGNGPIATVVGDAALGRELFRGKAGCYECHMMEGSGGFLGPDLSKFAETHSAPDIRSAIVAPEKKPGPRRSAATVTTSDGKSYEGLVRNEDNFSLQLQSYDGNFHLFSKSELAKIDIHQGSIMPSNYGSKLSPSELDALVAFLVRSAQEKGNHKKGL